MPNVYEPLVLEIEPPYIGSAVSPTVDITETSDDVTVTITDSRGEHSYTVDKTDQAIADAEAAAANANQAAQDVQSAVDAASTAATRANESADAANQAAQEATQAAESLADGVMPGLTAGMADAVFGETETLVTFPHISEHSGAARISSIHGNTIVENGSLSSVNIEGIESAGKTREIPIATYFPDGMRSAGSVYDELTSDKAVTRIGAVDLGALDWYMGGTNVSGVYRLRSLNTYSSAKPVSANTQYANVLCAAYPTTTASGMWANPQLGVAIDSSGYVWVYDPNYNTAGSEAAFKSAMSGVVLYYEFATPTETPIDPPLNLAYPTDQGGTESIVIPTGEMSAAPTMAVVYAYNADGVRDQAQAIIATIEGATASTNYAIGGYFVHAGKLYKATSAIATGEDINPGTNCTDTTVMAELVRLTA